MGKLMKILLILSILLVFVTVSGAAPFLIADTPPPEQQITHYNIYKDGVAEGTFQGETLHYDLQGVTPGAYDWTAEACNYWECKITPNPYVSASGAGAPLNMRLIP